jgi:hypothetical protein
MHCTARLVVAAWIVLVTACSDDGLNVQNQNSSTSGEPNDGSGNATTIDDGVGGDATMSGSGAASGSDDATQGSPETSSTSGPATDDGITTDASSTDASTTDASTTDASTTDASTTDASTTGEPCDPITEDASAINVDCLSDLDCPVDYTCQPFVGFAFQQTCQILCTETCECPMGLTCLEIIDKTGIPWHQCG